MTLLTFRELLKTARQCKLWGYSTRETMLFLYGLDHGLEFYYKE